jgi:hypothetical protein
MDRDARPHHASSSGPAEAIPLPDASIDVVLVGRTATVHNARVAAGIAGNEQAMRAERQGPRSIDHRRADWGPWMR